MRDSTIAILALCTLAVVACVREGSDAGINDTGREIPATLGADTVYLVRSADSNALLWRRGAVGRAWRADTLLGARPAVKLEYIDGDSTPDLFFSVLWEEFIFGELWLGRGQQEIQAFKSADDACRISELRDVNGDGRADIVDWRAGALRPGECYGDVLAAVCQRTYPTDWPDVWIQAANGDFARDSVAAQSFYRTMSAAFAQGARALRATLREHAELPADSQRCDENLAKAIETMARRSDVIAGMR